MDTSQLEGGFSNPPIDAAHAFRAVMDAMARPGRIYAIEGGTPPAPLSAAAGTVLLTLCDADTPIFLAGAADTDAVRTWIAFHTSAPLTGPSHAMFALGTWQDLMPLSQYPIGSPQYPDRSTTLIVEMPHLKSEGSTLRGPGIQSTAAFAVPDIDAFQSNHALYPLGLDFIFTCGRQVAALPRSTDILGAETN